MNGVIPGIFKTHIVATGVTSLLADKEKPKMTTDDVRNIKTLAKHKDLFDVLGNSIAPTIHGNL